MVNARRGWAPRILIGIALAYIGILILWPVAAIFQGAFAQGVDAALAILTLPDVQQAFLLTIELAAVAVMVNGVLGTVVAWVLVRQNFRGRSILNGLIDLPFVVSPVIAGYMIILLFGRQGWFNGLVQATGFPVAFALPGMLLVTIFVSLPFTIREIMPVLKHIGLEPEQAAYTMGASPWLTFRRVTLPAIRWGLLYGLTLTLARALGEFGAVLVVGGAIIGHTETATLYIYRALDQRQYVGAYTASVVLAVLSFVILIGMELLRKRTEVEQA
ncbi:MAG: sulfate ABC transporter permease subunit [Anaerolineae bacterium]